VKAVFAAVCSVEKPAIGFLAQPFLLSIKCYPDENAEYQTVIVDVIFSIIMRLHVI
jgi:hypothetical protein